MNWVLIFLAVTFCMRDIIEAGTDDVMLGATSRSLDILGGPTNDAPPTRRSTGSDDVRCTTIDDVTAARSSLCPAPCRCSPLSGQSAWTELTANCSGAQFNQSTLSRLSQDLTQLLTRCTSELQQLTITSTPLTALPEVVCRLSKIRALNLNSNRLASLPSNCFTRMLSLTSFSASYNNLTSLQVRLCH